MRMWKLWAFIVGLLSAGLAAAAEPSPGLRSFRYTEPSAVPMRPILLGANVTLGWAFRVGKPVRLTQLGFYDAGKDGLITSHKVGIWDNQKKLLRKAIVNHGEQSPRVRQYRYAPVRPIVLRPGQTYVIGATVPYVFPKNQPASEGWVSQPWYDPYPLYDVDDDSIRLAGVVKMRASGRRGANLLADPQDVEGPGRLMYPGRAPDEAFFLAANFLFEKVEAKPHALASLSISEESRTETLLNEHLRFPRASAVALPETLHSSYAALADPVDVLPSATVPEPVASTICFVAAGLLMRRSRQPLRQAR